VTQGPLSTKTVAARLASYKAIQRRLLADLAVLTRWIEAEQKAGRPVSTARLQRQQRFRDLLTQTAVQMDRYAKTVEQVTVQQATAAAGRGTRDAAAAIKRELGPPPAGLAVSFNSLPVGAVNDITARLGSGKPLRELFDSFGTDAAKLAREALITSVGLGLGPRKTAAAVRDALNVSTVRALTIARTEQMKAYRSASLQTYQANNSMVKGWRWRCSRSPRTCAMCWAMDGEEFALDEPFASHPNCRCAPIPITKTWAELGFGGIPDRPPPEPGSAVFARLSEAEQRHILGPGRLALYQQGTPLSAFVQKTTSKTWGPGRQVRPLYATKAGPPPLPKVLQPKPVTLDSIKTLDDATKWAKQAYPSIEWDFEGAHVDVIRPMLTEFDRLGKRYPQVVDRLQYVGTYGTPGNKIHPHGYDWEQRGGGAIAHAQLASGRYMGLNPKYVGNPQLLQQADDRSVRAGWLHKGTTGPEATISHEFAHLYDGYLRTVGDGLVPYVGADGVGTVSGTLTAWRQQHKATAALSRYATTNLDEGFAEAFSLMQSDIPKAKWPKFVKELDQLLNLIETSPRIPQGYVEYTGSLSGMEREKALATLRELRAYLGIK
jgi:SPP1 gp7 family putative phage head morphogenesis protein